MSIGRQGAVRVVLGGICLVAMLLAGFLIAALFVPLPLSLLQPLVEARFSRLVAPLDLSAGSLAVTWDPAAATVTLDAEEVLLLDREERVVGNLPRVEVDLSLGELLHGRSEIAAIRLYEAKVALEMEEKGPRLSVGPYGPATEEAFLSGAGLGEVVSAFWDCRLVLPEIRLVDGLFFFLDPDAAVNLRFAVENLALRPGAGGSRTSLSSHLLVAGQRLEFDLTAEQDCAAGTLALSLYPKAVNPAILGEIVPGGGQLYPFEIPVSGRFDLDLGPDRNLLGLNFSLEGGAGSLEVASYAASNLAVEGMTLVGSYDALLQTLTLSEGRFELGRGTLLLEGTLRREAGTSWVSLHILFLGDALAQLLPRWFAGLQNALRRAATDEEIVEIGLDLSGSVDRDHTIAADGSFFLLAEPDLSESSPGSAGRLDFHLAGHLSEPRLVLTGQSP